MNRFVKGTLIAAGIIAATATTAAAFGPGRGGFGPCWGEGRGQAAWGDNAGPGMMGAGPGFHRGQQVDKQLTADDVRAIVAGRLAMRGNKRLKVGEVVEKDADTVTAEIVTVDNSLVQVLEVDRHTGFTRPVAQ